MDAAGLHGEGESYLGMLPVGDAVNYVPDWWHHLHECQIGETEVTPRYACREVSFEEADALMTGAGRPNLVDELIEEPDAVGNPGDAMANASHDDQGLWGALPGLDWPGWPVLGAILYALATWLYAASVTP